MKNRPFQRRAFRCLTFVIVSAGAVLAPYAQGAEAPPGRLKFVLIFSRHGVRAPTGKNDQLNQYSAQPWPKWDSPAGYLTPQGATLMTLFGNYYRAYFAQQEVVSASGCGDATHVSFFADSDQRTAETGKSLAAGMFPGCSAHQQPEQHTLAEGQVDPIFHSLSAGVGQPDRTRAAASIAGRIGGNPAGVTEAYRLQLELLQRILLGCAPASPCPQPGPTAAALLLDTPASLGGGKSDHLAELKGPLNTASTITENLMLEYTNGLPADQVGWGLVDLPTLKQLMDLHTAASDLNRRTPYLATVQASNTLAHILDTLRQAATGKACAGALGKPGDRVVVLVGHDTNLANIAGMLNLNWVIDGRRDDTPPGGALVFELWQGADNSAYEVRAYYTAQTLEQMREVTPLTLDKPPARADIFIPGCSRSGVGFPCDWKDFQKTLTAAIDPAFVK
jgi:4-phytase / acid phosphatase